MPNVPSANVHVPSANVIAAITRMAGDRALNSVLKMPLTADWQEVWYLPMGSRILARVADYGGPEYRVQGYCGTSLAADLAYVGN